MSTVEEFIEEVHNGSRDFGEAMEWIEALQQQNAQMQADVERLRQAAELAYQAWYCETESLADAMSALREQIGGDYQKDS